MKRAIIITDAGTARKLIRDGEVLIDIKPHRNVPNASVFIFQPSKNIEEVVQDGSCNGK